MRIGDYWDIGPPRQENPANLRNVGGEITSCEAPCRETFARGGRRESLPLGQRDLPTPPARKSLRPVEGGLLLPRPVSTIRTNGICGRLQP